MPLTLFYSHPYAPVMLTAHFSQEKKNQKHVGVTWRFTQSTEKVRSCGVKLKWTFSLVLPCEKSASIVFALTALLAFMLICVEFTNLWLRLNLNNKLPTPNLKCLVVKVSMKERKDNLGLLL